MLNVTSWTPSFDNNTERQLRKKLISKYAFYCFIFSVIWTLIIIPLHNYLSLRQNIFRVGHKIRRHIKQNWPHLHQLPFYHNRSIRLFIFWTVIILSFALYKDSIDLLQITKRLGRISTALLPTILFLTLKPSPLPKILYLTLLPLHKWLSRSLVLAAFLHSTLYLVYFIKKGTVHKILKLANMYGVIAMSLFLIIVVSSLKMVRRSNYRFFYYVHYASTWIVIFLLHFHARPRATGYTTLSIAVLVYQIGYRLFHTTTVIPTIIRISPTLTMLEFPISEVAKKPVLPSAHVRIVLKSKNIWKRWFYHVIPFTHPFTLLNLPSDTTAKLLIRHGNFPLLSGAQYNVTGVYEPAINFISKRNLPLSDDVSTNTNNPFQTNSSQLVSSPLHYIVNARRVLIFVGGSAISFGLPLLRVLNFNGVMVRLIWCVRDYRDLKLLNYLKMNYYQGLEVFISGQTLTSGDENIKIDYYDAPSQPSPPQSEVDSKTHLLHKNTEQGSSTDPNDEIDFTSTNLNSPLSAPSNSKNNDIFRKPQIIEPPHSCNEQPHDETDRIKLPSFVKVSYGRPKLTESYYDWCLQRECISTENLNVNTDSSNNEGGSDNQCIEHRLSNKDEEILSTVWVVAAGPMSLVKTTRNWAKDYGLRFHGEEYTM